MNKKYTWTLLASITMIMVITFAYAPHDAGELIRSGPYRGMVYIPGGTFTYKSSGTDVEDIIESREVTIDAFYMDETEITNKQYREFVEWVRDSLAITDQGLSQFLDSEGLIDWEKVKHRRNGLWANREDPAISSAWDRYQSQERDPKLREWDQLKLNRTLLKYSYKTIDQRAAAFAFREDHLNFDPRNFERTEVVEVYPDITSWWIDFSYSYNDPHFGKYFTHPSYDDYPVVGISWKQAQAFNHWRTLVRQREVNLRGNSQNKIGDFTLPPEAFWQYAAEGGQGPMDYPVASELINKGGILMAKFKSGRGNYLSNGEDVRTVKVKSYYPNGFNLYDMAGNVAEWTLDAYNPSSITIGSSLAPSLAQDSNPIKVVKGGSWKDSHDYLKMHKRTVEHQDSSRSFIGFRSIIQ